MPAIVTGQWIGFNSARGGAIMLGRMDAKRSRAWGKARAAIMELG